jgi:hypothetical protein
VVCGESALSLHELTDDILWVPETMPPGDIHE